VNKNWAEKKGEREKEKEQEGLNSPSLGVARLPCVPWAREITGARIKCPTFSLEMGS
jgi:hypothetical protein